MTSLGATFTDGGVTWQAIRGPLVYYRKLRTAPTQAVIPYARPYAGTATPEYFWFPKPSRTGVGIDNQSIW